MTTSLRDVLNAFDQGGQARSLTQIARDLHIDPARLEGMLDYWVRKGELREVRFASDCGSCGVKAECPFIVRMPRSYERVRDDDPPPCGPQCAC